MTFVEDVQSARTPREALLTLAARLDRLAARVVELENRQTDAWDSWEEGVELRTEVIPGYDPEPPAVMVRAGEIDEGTYVVIPPVSEAKKQARRLFEQQSLHLSEYLADDSQDWNELYAKGGPMWIYLANRDLVMSLPIESRQHMITDIEEYSPVQAQEVARDILKAPCEATGFGQSPAMADEFEGGV